MFAWCPCLLRDFLVAMAQLHVQNSYEPEMNELLGFGVAVLRNKVVVRCSGGPTAPSLWDGTCRLQPIVPIDDHGFQVAPHARSHACLHLGTTPPCPPAHNTGHCELWP
jgi:hypothetical protein